MGGLVKALMDVLGYLGASLWRFLALWVRLLVGTLGVLGCTCVCIPATLFWYVFTQGYLDPVRPRAPPYACVRLYAPAPAGVPARLRAPTCVSFSALGSSLVRFCIAPIALWLRHVVPVRFLGFLCASGACLFRASLRLFRALVCASVRCWVFLGYASAWLSYFVRRWRYLSFILLHSASYILSNACVPKLSYINHIFSVYL